MRWLTVARLSQCLSASTRAAAVYKRSFQEVMTHCHSSVAVSNGTTCTNGRHYSGTSFNYENQYEREWLKLPGSQSGGKRQSPIDIDTSTTKSSSVLVPLQFSGYDDPQDITLKNKGTNITFLPSVFPAALTNHLGVYSLREFHFHWGRTNDEGSEHTFDRKQFAAEIHFVHLKEGASPTDTTGDTFSVVGVLCKAADIPVSGVWSKFGPVPTANDTKNLVSNIMYSELLPEKRDYYHYEGSLTTPLCSEIVQWFVMKDTIEIPEAFLASLRRVEMDKSGKCLTHNFRDLQSLNNREVFHFSS